jgi:PAS domain S-box-containing protein
MSNPVSTERAPRPRPVEALIRESDDRYRTLFNLCPVAVYSCATSGVIQAFNQRAADLWGRKPALGDTDEQFCGSYKLFRPDGTFMAHADCPMAEVLNGTIPEMRDADVVIERPDGSRITVVVNIRPLLNDRGEVTGAINCFYDITDRIRMEREVKEQAAALMDLHRRKDEFLAMLSHELRNPLAPITNAVHILRLQSDETPMQQQARAIIERQVAQLTRLIDDLLEVSRITTGRIQLRRERVLMSGIIERAVETARPVLDQRKHELTVALPEQLICLDADAARLEQVFVNLLANAAKYTQERGRVALTVNVESPGGQQVEECVVRVRDSGIGIAPELVPHVFELFTQADRALEHSQGGLGIGLALVRRIVEMHGGRVEVHSEIGHGSEFVVRLPLEEPVSPAVAALAS